MNTKKALSILITFTAIISVVLLLCSCQDKDRENLYERDLTPSASVSTKHDINAGGAIEDEAEQMEPPSPPAIEVQTKAPPTPIVEENTDIPVTVQIDEPALPTAPAVQEIPDVLAKYYEKAPDGVSYFGLPTSTRQLVVVDDSDAVIRVHFFEMNDNDEWMEFAELEKQAWGGSNGIRPKQREGDRVTPVGQFPILEAFYIDNKPETGLDIFHITNDTYWVDDPDSVFYNQYVEGTANKDWNSAEHMISYPGSYKYGFVIGYNLDCTPGLGSAVFFHVAQRNTIGCVGVSEESCLQYLAILDKDLSPYILIVSNKEAL